MFSSQSVMKGPLEAFEAQLDDPETWCAVFRMLQVESACIRLNYFVIGWAKNPLKTPNVQSQILEAITGACCRYLVDGKRPANMLAKTVLVTSLDWKVWKVG